MKTFQNLVEEVQDAGLCHHCGGCVTFCTAINFGALKQDSQGKPCYDDMEKCIECGICYMICPEIDELDEETRKRIGWIPPMGRVLETTVARAANESIRQHATDGGVVTALLLHLFDAGRIDGAIVTRQTGLFKREPWLATSRREIIEAAGFFFDASHGMSLYSEQYSTYSPSVQMLGQMTRRGTRRVAMVGTPCQIKTIRKMETLGIVPTDSINYILGLFCSGNFLFGAEQREQLEALGNFSWNQVRKLNIKEELYIHSEDGEIRTIPLNQLGFMRRFACQYCDDYAAEFADISFGGIAAQEGWTTVVARTPLGRAAFAHARGEGDLEIHPQAKDPRFVGEVSAKIQEWSKRKREQSLVHRAELSKKPVESKNESEPPN
jgi:coenzyme F420 hydrogenase subunit beta